MRYFKRALRPALFLILFIFFLLQQNFTLQREAVSLSSAKLPPAFSGLRIVQISDLHGRSFGKEHRLLLSAVAEASPDLICVTGDFFEEQTELLSLKPLVQGLCRIAPTFYVTGNHEWQRKDLMRCLELLEQWGACVLRNEYRLLQRGTSRILIAGVDDPCGPYDQKTPEMLMTEIREREGEDIFVLMLDHRNDRLSLWAALGADLVLSGHCHGGVIRLPLVGGLIGTDRSLFPDYDAGLYRQGDTQLYVSRGMGFPLRLFNRPHLPVFTLHS